MLEHVRICVCGGVRVHVCVWGACECMYMCVHVCVSACACTYVCVCPTGVCGVCTITPVSLVDSVCVCVCTYVCDVLKRSLNMKHKGVSSCKSTTLSLPSPIPLSSPSPSPSPLFPPQPPPTGQTGADCICSPEGLPCPCCSNKGTQTGRWCERVFLVPSSSL